jgi:hypothetical protein
MLFERKIGRLAVGVRHNRDGGGYVIDCLNGHNDGCETLRHCLDDDEVKDLLYMLERAREKRAEERLYYNLR